MGGTGRPRQAARYGNGSAKDTILDASLPKTSASVKNDDI